jgi:tetratricopeptide (TPR) repeat protein
VTITRDFPDARLTLSTQSRVVEDWAGALSIREPLMLDIAVPPGTEDRDLIVELYAGGKQILRYSAGEVEPAPAPELATEPPEPSLIENMETLYLTGVHLEQYRHATRAPEPYWQEALRRDPGDSRSNMALGRWHLRRGELHAAEEHIRRSIQRLTERNPNPADGEPFYYLGLVLRLLGRSREAYDAFYKSIWNAAWKAPGYLALTEIDVAAGRWEMAAEHVQLSLRADEDCNHASSLQYLILNHLGRTDDAVLVLGDALRRDPLDIWFRYLAGQELPQNAQQCIDLALDCMRAGLLDDAATGLRSVNVDLQNGAGAIALYLLAQMSEEHGDFETARKLGTQAAAAPPEYVFPHRIEEMLALEAACARNHSDARAPYYLGNYLYSFGRYSEAIDRWETATRLDPAFPTAWRNLGLALYNIRHDENTALDAFDRAFRADPRDARVFYERDQLWKRAGYSPEQRLAELRRYPELVRQRDDLSIEFVTLLNDTGLPEEARALLAERHFQPWEGGEGLVLAQFVRTHLLLGRRALAAGDPDGAVRAFREACHPWKNLSEAKHLLANSSELDYWLGVALAASGDSRVSVQMFERAARQRGDFQKMSVRAISEMTYWAAMAELKLGHKQAATNLFEQILACSFEREREPAKTDYFATSLPTMLLFEEDLEKRKDIEAWFLRAQAFAGLGRMDECRRLLQQILDRDRNHAEAADLLSNLETTVHS